MEIHEQFRTYLQNQKKQASKSTLKNYLADLSQFTRWFQASFGQPFHPDHFTTQVIDAYKEASKGLSKQSLNRHMSTLRKFAQFLKLSRLQTVNPFDQIAASVQAQKIKDDPWSLHNFKNYLYVYNSSPLTIKNYIMDVRQFLNWLLQVSGVEQAWEIKEKNIFAKISSEVIEEYKARLIHEVGLSPISINRKLSSLRRYLSFAEQEGLLKKHTAIPTIASVSKANQLPQAAAIASATALSNQEDLLPTEVTMPSAAVLPASTYSKFPPFRLAQRFLRLGNHLFDTTLIVPLVRMIEKVTHAWWKLNGSHIFTSNLSSITSTLIKPSMLARLQGTLNVAKFSVKNISKGVYAPLAISTVNMPTHRKVWHHLRHTRPNWYKRYHTYPITHYLHFAILVVVMAGIGFAAYNSWITDGKKSPVLAAAATPLKILSFQGRLTDALDNPITSAQKLRFEIYSDSTASGAARLWEEVRDVSPDQDGIFSVLLASDGAGGNASLCNGGAPPSSPATGACGIPQSLFRDNSAVWLGISVNKDSELTPRQQVATVAYATNAEVLQGLPPTTDSAFAAGSSNANAILALNSTGQIIIPGTSQTTFQATGGTLKITGQALTLSTNAASNGQIIIDPDGTGQIDLRKPLVNNTLTGNIPTAAGAVEVDDLFAILASSSGQSAFTINQTGAGPLISASSSGTAKFTVGNDGSGYFAGNVGIGTRSPSAPLHIADATNTQSLKIINSNTGTSGVLYLQTTNAGVGSSMYTENNRGSFASYGGYYYGGSGDANGALFGLSRADKLFLFADGVSNLGMAVGTLSNQPLMFGTNNAERVRILADGNVGIGTTTPGTKLDFGATTGDKIFLFNGSGNKYGFGVSSGGPLQIFSGTGTGATTIGNYDGTTFTERMRIEGPLVGIGITNPASSLHINAAYGGNAAAIIDQRGTNTPDIFTASAGGTTKFTIANTGALTSAAYTGNNAALYGTATTGVIASATTSTSNLCLLSGSSTPSWGACDSAAGVNLWQTLSGTIQPKIQTQDLLLGGTATTSAKFGFINVNSGTPTASISANSGNNATYLTGTGTLSTTNMQGLTLGGATTGSVSLAAGSGTSALFVANGGNVGIGTTTPSALIHGLKTTEQLRLGYDASNYSSFTVSSDGRLNVSPTSGLFGINAVPSAGLHVIRTSEQLRVGYDTGNYWTNTVGSTGGLTMAGVGTGGSLTLQPTAGQNLNVTLSTTGDFAVNTNQLYVDTSAGNVGICIT